MKKLIHFIGFMIVGLTLFQSCSKDEGGYNGPAKTMMWYSVDDAKRQVAFTALTQQVNSWTWDFGDGKTSTEKNPVHIYDVGGIYTVKLTAKGAAVDTTVVAKIPVDLTNYVKLTGGGAYPNGKTWKLNGSATAIIAHADDNFSSAQNLIGVYDFKTSDGFGLYLGIGEIFDDTYTFKSDGTYTHFSPHNPTGSFTGLSFATVFNQTVLNPSNDAAFRLCYAAFTPEANSTFSFTENEDLAIATADFPTGPVVNRTYKNVMTLDFSGTEFIGLRDFTRKCIVQEITPTSMTLIEFFSYATLEPSLIIKLTYIAQ